VGDVAVVADDASFASDEERKLCLDSPARKCSRWLGAMTNRVDVISVS
jgi:hypothetical protein